MTAATTAPEAAAAIRHEAVRHSVRLLVVGARRAALVDLAHAVDRQAWLLGVPSDVESCARRAA